jgi:starch-binding outer membrane protein SusE/F
MRLKLLFSTVFCALSIMVSAQVTKVGIIGIGSPTGNWDVDTDLVQNATDTAKWSGTFDLTAAKCKLRANDAWDTAWGSTDWPTGIADTKGPDMVIKYKGKYNVDFNHVTGAFNFGVITDIGIIGDATVGGFDYDTDMFQLETDTNQYEQRITLKAGKVKFRQYNAWATAWGASTFPTGVATLTGGDIIVAAGTYNVSFNKSTGAFNFEEIKAYNSIGAIGTATGGGLADLDLTKSPDDADVWFGQLSLVAGSLRFRANDTTLVSWGGGLAWPAGTASKDSAALVVPTAGKYLVVLNVKTGEYKFFQAVGIIGPSTPGGWGADTDMLPNATNPFVFEGRLKLLDGDAKFRADNDWKISWGGALFPAGPASSANIPVSAGDYKISLNTVNGAYSFFAVVAYDSVGLIGINGPNANWTDPVFMKKDPLDEFHFFLPSATVTTSPSKNDGVKFRVGRNWDVNWGNPTAWPSGVGTQGGDNIQTIAGTYKVDLNTTSGAYSFGPVSSTINLLDQSALALSPNPVSNWLTIEVKDALLQGETRVIFLDATGRQVISQTVQVTDVARLDVSALVPGNYFIQITNGKYMVGRQVSVQH